METKTYICDECFTPIKECECGDTQTAYVREGAVCPYCGELNSAEETDGALYGSLEQFKCMYCRKEFNVQIDHDPSWSTSRKG